jgi:leucyl-tRNA synthetase
MMEYVNTLRTAESGLRSAVEPLLVMLAPYAPHLAEELWERLGHTGRTVFDERWPVHDPRLATAGDVEIAIQVNGKLRGRLTVPRGASQQDVVARALAEEGVKKFANGNAVKKVVFVQDRLVNLVV